MSGTQVWLCQSSRPLPGQELWSAKPSKACWVALHTNQKASEETLFQIKVAAQCSKLGVQREPPVGTSSPSHSAAILC